MRSRYTAYALQLEGYLLDTWELSTRPAQFEFEAGLLWKSLIISECRKGRQKDAQGWVTFTAFYQVGLEHGKVREKSHFKRDGKGHWCYVDGEF